MRFFLGMRFFLLGMRFFLGMRFWMQARFRDSCGGFRRIWQRGLGVWGLWRCMQTHMDTYTYVHIWTRMFTYGHIQRHMETYRDIWRHSNTSYVHAPKPTSLAIECVLLLQNVFSCYRMCSLAIECVLLLQNVFSCYRMCSLAIECVLLLQNVFSFYRITETMHRASQWTHIDTCRHIQTHIDTHRDMRIHRTKPYVHRTKRIYM